ncbi:DUF6898 family protein [Coralliovum pocilloporae]|uniref:DUF6898 family protein n=1 Tax=Coralliovum pocilloporae TaxID=3066369 RepID=UPI003307015B
MSGTVFLEFIRVGQQLKVNAIDEATGIEVSVFGPVNGSRTELQSIAIQKLRRRLEREGQA